MAAMGHDGSSLPFDFKFPFQNKGILIKLNLINKTTNQLGLNKWTTIYASKSKNQLGFGYQFEM